METELWLQTEIPSPFDGVGDTDLALFCEAAQVSGNDLARLRQES